MNTHLPYAIFDTVMGLDKKAWVFCTTIKRSCVWANMLKDSCLIKSVPSTIAR